MKTLASRVDKLEGKGGDPEFCQCEGPIRVSWPDDPPPPDVCERCGKPIRTIQVVFDEPPSGEMQEEVSNDTTEPGQ